MMEQVGKRLFEIFLHLKRSKVEGSDELVRGIEESAKGGGRCLRCYIVERISETIHPDIYWGFVIYDLLVSVCDMVDWDELAEMIVEADSASRQG
jgi:hypothetical protein